MRQSSEQLSICSVGWMTKGVGSRLPVGQRSNDSSVTPIARELVGLRDLTGHRLWMLLCGQSFGRELNRYCAMCCRG